MWGPKYLVLLYPLPHHQPLRARTGYNIVPKRDLSLVFWEEVSYGCNESVVVPPTVVLISEIRPDYSCQTTPQIAGLGLNCIRDGELIDLLQFRTIHCVSSHIGSPGITYSLLQQENWPYTVSKVPTLGLRVVCSFRMVKAYISAFPWMSFMKIWEGVELLPFLWFFGRDFATVSISDLCRPAPGSHIISFFDYVSMLSAPITRVTLHGGHRVTCPALALAICRLSYDHNAVSDGQKAAPEHRRKPARGGQNLTDRYKRLENSLRGKEAISAELSDLTHNNLSTSSGANISASRRPGRMFRGFEIPEEPKPPADDGKYATYTKIWSTLLNKNYSLRMLHVRLCCLCIRPLRRIHGSLQGSRGQPPDLTFCSGDTRTRMAA